MKNTAEKCSSAQFLCCFKQVFLSTSKICFIQPPYNAVAPKTLSQHVYCFFQFQSAGVIFNRRIQHGKLNRLFFVFRYKPISLNAEQPDGM